MPLGIYGKHPAKGDFLDFGVPAPLLKQVEAWLDTALGEAREVLGGEWEAIWSRAPVLRFWLGEGVWGGPVAGVMVASRDKVGRRFPLVLLASGTDAPPPPVVDPAQPWHDAGVAHLARLLALGDFASNARLLDGAPVAGSADQPGPGDFWAVRPGDSLEALWSDVAVTDHRRAAAGRSYWWVAGEPEAAAPWPDAVEPEPVEPDPADPEPADPEPASPKPTDPDLPDPVAPPGDPPAEDAPDPVPEVADPQTQPDSDTEDDVFAVADDGPMADPWGLVLPDVPEDDSSPFDAPAMGFRLFAAPEAAAPQASVAAAPAPDAPPPPRGPALRAPLWSQVWAGEGLPSGAVLAWFFRGHVGNG